MIPPIIILALASIALGFAIGWVLRGRMAGLDAPRPAADRESREPNERARGPNR